jgi:hypothetical protein
MTIFTATIELELEAKNEDEAIQLADEYLHDKIETDGQIEWEIKEKCDKNEENNVNQD